MGCRSDYLEATGLEKGLQQAAKLAVFVDNKLCGITPSAIVDQSKEYYSKDVGQVQYLCDKLTRMGEADRERIVYDAHNPVSRELAEWWETHQAADAARISKEQAIARQAALLRSARAKLSPEELEAVRQS
jgi:hypothetical protein